MCPHVSAFCPHASASVRIFADCPHCIRICLHFFRISAMRANRRSQPTTKHQAWRAPVDEACVARYTSGRNGQVSDRGGRGPPSAVMMPRREDLALGLVLTSPGRPKPTCPIGRLHLASTINPTVRRRRGASCRYCDEESAVEEREGGAFSHPRGEKWKWCNKQQYCCEWCNNLRRFWLQHRLVLGESIQPVLLEAMVMELRPHQPTHYLHYHLQFRAFGGWFQVHCSYFIDGSMAIRDY